SSDALAVTRNPQGGTLWLLRIDPTSGKPASVPQEIGPGAANHAPCFSPDGRFIAYAREAPDATSSDSKYPPVSLAIAGVNGGGIQTIARAVELRVMGWVPDGSAVYYSGYVDATSTKRQRFRVSLSGEPTVLLPESQNVAWPNYVDPNTGDVKAIF